MIKLLRSALVSSSPPFTLAAKCRPYSCAEYSRGKETISADTLYSERYSDFGRHCTGDNYLSALSALRLQETTTINVYHKSVPLRCTIKVYSKSVP